MKQASDTARWFAACRIPLYFVMLYSTLFVGAVSLVFSSLHVPDPSVSVDPFIALLAGVISAIVPDMIGGYIEGLFKHWWWLTLFVGVFGILGWARGFFLRATRDTASLGWRYQALVNLDKEKGNEKSNKERVDLSATIGELQASRGTAFWWAVEGSGVARNAGILIACAIFIAASWVLVSTRFDGDFQAACALIEAKSLETDEKTQVFATRNPCHRTRWDVNSGEPVFLQVEASGWFDKTISATPSGFVSKAHEESKLMNDFRHSLRNPDAKYFTLLGQVLTYGEEGVASVRWRERLDFTLFGWHFMDSFGINRSVARAVQRFEASDVKDALSGSFSDAESSGKFSRVEDHSCGNNIFKWTPPETGELTLFVNDVDMAKAKLWPESLSWSADWWFPANRYSFYENNRGSAIVSRIDPMSCKLWEEQTRSN